MEITQIISKSKDNQRAEVIIQTDKGFHQTKHIHKTVRGWTYCERTIYKENGEKKFIIKSFTTQPDI